KIIEPLWGSTSRKMPFFSAVTLGNEVSRNNSIHNGIGEQVPNRRFRMTGNCGTLSYRFFTHRSESDMPERDSEHSERTIFFPRVDLLKNISPFQGLSGKRYIFLQRCHPRWGFSANTILPEEVL